MTGQDWDAYAPFEERIYLQRHGWKRVDADQWAAPETGEVLDTEGALDAAGYTELGQRAYGEWHKIVDDANRIAHNDEDSNCAFERIGRGIFKLWSDPEYRAALEINYFGDFFRDPEIEALVKKPIIKFKIDLSGGSFAQTNRFLFALKLDNAFPDKHILKQECLTWFTQTHRKEFSDLLDAATEGKDIAETAFDDILTKDEEPKPEETFLVQVQPREILVNGKTAIRIDSNRDLNDPMIHKLKSRVLTEKVNFLINVAKGEVLESTEKGLLRIGTWCAGKDEGAIRFFEGRGFQITESE